jgi:hypothetical protein
LSDGINKYFLSYLCGSFLTEGDNGSIVSGIWFVVWAM